MTDFKSNYVMASQYNNKAELLKALGKNITRPGTLVIVEAGRLELRRSDGVTADAAVTDVKIHTARRIAPTGIGLDVGNSYWMLEFQKVHKSRQMHEGGVGAKITAASAFGNFKALKVGKQLRDEFLASLRSQGASEATG